tara:strand:+ start:1390 stop:1674 length:285 start_codon:yes stop_codon:yes gene_type:complete
MDNNKKSRVYVKKSRNAICKNSGCCGCNSLKKQFRKKNIIIEEIDNQIVSTKEDITHLLDELNKYICPSVFETLGISENDLVSQSQQTSTSTST